MTTTSGFVTSFIINLTIAIIVITLFCYFRTRYQWIYEPRLDAKKRKNAIPPPDPGKGFLSTWLMTTIKTSDTELISTNGLDGAIFVKFFALACKFFAITTLFGCIILIPVNSTGENTNLPSNDPNYVEGFEALSMSGVAIKSSRYWVHLIISYIYMFILYYLMYEMWQFYQLHRFQYLSNQYLLGRNMSLIQHSVPKDLQNREALLNYWKKECGDDVIADVTIAVNTENLSDLVAEREQNIAALEHCYAVLEENQKLPAEDKHHNERPMKAKTCFCYNKVDAIEFHTSEINRLNNEIAEIQSRKHQTCSSAIINFSSVTAMTEAYHRRNGILKLCSPLVSRQLKPAVEPRDVVWKNMKYEAIQKTIRRIIAAAITGWLICFWIIPVTFAQGLADLKKLGSNLGIGSAIDAIPTVPISIIEGYLPGLVVIVFFIILPLILRVFSEKVQGVETESMIQKSVLSKYFLFQILNNFLFLTAASSIFSKLTEMRDDPSSIPSFLGISIPRTATYFVTYVLLQALAVFPMAQLRIAALIVGVLKRKYLAKTQREIEVIEACPAPDYGTMFSFHLIIWVIGVCYAAISPIVLPFCAIFFGLGYIISKYQQLYLYNPVFETGGTFWPVVFTRMMAAAIVANLTLVGILGLKQVPAEASLSVPLPFISFAFILYIHHKFKDECEFLPISECKLIDEKRKNASRYYNSQAGHTKSIDESNFVTAESTEVGMYDNSVLPLISDDTNNGSRPQSVVHAESNQMTDEAERTLLNLENATLAVGNGQEESQLPFLDIFIQPELAAEKIIPPPTSAAMTKPPNRAEMSV